MRRARERAGRVCPQRNERLGWTAVTQVFRDAAEPAPLSAYRRQLEDATTIAFIAALRREPLLKAVLVGHSHITVQDRFSPTAMEFGVGANYLFHGEEILFS